MPTGGAPPRATTPMSDLGSGACHHPSLGRWSPQCTHICITCAPCLRRCGLGRERRRRSKAFALPVWPKYPVHQVSVRPAPNFSERENASQLLETRQDENRPGALYLYAGGGSRRGGRRLCAQFGGRRPRTCITKCTGDCFHNRGGGANPEPVGGFHQGGPEEEVRHHPQGSTEADCRRAGQSRHYFPR